MTSRAEMDAQYPEHAKLREIGEESQAIGQFLENSGYVLAEWVDDRQDALAPVGLPVEQVLAAYFNIDLVKIEAEKRAMLAGMRASHEGTSQ